MHPAKVVSMTDYGVFVELPNGRQALVHISELSHDKVNIPKFLLAYGRGQAQFSKSSFCED